MTGGNWRKSSKCSSSECIEVRRAAVGMLEIRSSDEPDEPYVLATDAEFAAFVEAAKAGEYDDLTGSAP